MTDSDRNSTLRDLASEPTLDTPGLIPAPPANELGWDEILFLAEGLAFGPRALHEATAKITERHNLGPRGAWILQIISHGVAYPLELASTFCVGRSLITAELTRLTEAGLVDTRPGEGDRRRTALTLTPLGKRARTEIREELMRIVRRRLAAFEPDQVRLTAQVLRALSKDSELPKP